MLPLFQSLQESNTIDMVIVKGTGTEMFAKMAMDYSRNLIEELYGSRCWVESVTVREHGANEVQHVRTIHEQWIFVVILEAAQILAH